MYENLDVDYQMLINLGEHKPIYGPKYAFLRCIIGIYFLSFFIEHPVVALSLENPRTYNLLIPSSITKEGRLPHMKVTVSYIMTSLNQEFRVDETKLPH